MNNKQKKKLKEKEKEKEKGVGFVKNVDGFVLRYDISTGQTANPSSHHHAAYEFKKCFRYQGGKTLL